MNILLRASRVCLLAGLAACAHDGSFPVPADMRDVPSMYQLYSSLQEQRVPTCLLEWRLQHEIAGLPKDARACGHIRKFESWAPGDACVLESVRAGRPFWARYHPIGIDSGGTTLVVSAGPGDLRILDWDSAPCGEKGCLSSLVTVTCLDPRQVPAGQDHQIGVSPIACALFEGRTLRCPQGT